MILHYLLKLYRLKQMSIYGLNINCPNTQYNRQTSSVWTFSKNCHHFPITTSLTLSYQLIFNTITTSPLRFKFLFFPLYIRFIITQSHLKLLILSAFFSSLLAPLIICSNSVMASSSSSDSPKSTHIWNLNFLSWVFTQVQINNSLSL